MWQWYLTLICRATFIAENLSSQYNVYLTCVSIILLSLSMLSKGWTGLLTKLEKIYEVHEQIALKHKMQVIPDILLNRTRHKVTNLGKPYEYVTLLRAAFESNETCQEQWCTYETVSAGSDNDRDAGLSCNAKARHGQRAPERLPSGHTWILFAHSKYLRQALQKRHWCHRASVELWPYWFNMWNDA